MSSTHVALSAVESCRRRKATSRRENEEKSEDGEDSELEKRTLIIKRHHTPSWKSETKHQAVTLTAVSAFVLGSLAESIDLQYAGWTVEELSGS